MTVSAGLPQGPGVPDWDPPATIEERIAALEAGVATVGTNLASAATLVLPATGRYFQVTGTTNITAITPLTAGRLVVLRFAGILTVSDAGTIKLSAAFVTSADDTLTLICDGTNWYEIARAAN
jgi:hypothetical protein